MRRDLSSFPKSVQRAVVKAMEKERAGGLPVTGQEPIGSATHSTEPPQRIKRRKHEEDALQKATARLLRSLFPHVIAWHTPNGGLRSKAAGAMMKASGTRPGIPDWCFLLSDGRAGFIELKTDKGVVSDAQKEFREQAESRGCPYRVCRSLKEFQVIVGGWSHEGLI